MLTLSRNTPPRRLAPKSSHKVTHPASGEAAPELRSQLASLRIDRAGRAPLWRRWLPYAPVVLLSATALGLYLAWANPLSTIEVGVVRPTVEHRGSGSEGMPVLTASGYLVARRQAVVSAKIQGRLAGLRVEEGSRVREGEIIAQLESADYEAQVDVARAQAQHAEADLAEQQRQLHLAEELAQAQVVSQDQLQAAASRVRLADAALAQARGALALSQANLQNTIIRAPFSGVVLKKMAEVGESVAPIPPGVNISTSSGAIVALADMSTLELEADIGESSVSAVRPEQPAQVSVQAFPEREYRAVLRQIIPTADRTKATITVRVTILNRDGDLKPEMSARVTFLEAPTKGAPAPVNPIISVPKDAIALRDGRTVVFELKNDQRINQLAIITGAEDQGQVVVKSGLAGAETLVLNPPEGLKQGDKVKVKG